MDLAEGHASALEYLNSQTGLHAFNLGTGRGFSVLEMVRSFEEASQRKIPTKICARRPGDVATCYASPQLSFEMLGWSAKRGLDQMCLDHWNWQCQQERRLVGK